MSRYLVRRILQGCVVLVGVTLAVFLVLRLTGDPVRIMLPPEASEQDRQQLRTQLGLNDPVTVQYGRFLLGLLHGDAGKSLWQDESAMHLVLQRLPATYQLTFAALLVAVLVAVPLGVVAAVHRGKGVDHLAMVLAVGGQSMPTFWVGILLIMLLSVHWRLLPTSGRDGALSLIMPAISLALYSLARLARLTRSALLEVLHQDYVRTARAKGLAERVVIYRHALRNAAVPLITLVGLELGVLLGGAVITESVFAWPGVGRLALQGIQHRDFPLVQAAVMVVAATFVAINVVIDLLYGLLNPLIRVQRKGGAS